MSVRLRSTRLALAVAAALQSGCVTTGADNYVPPEALAPPMTQLADGLIKFEGDVKNESVRDYKRKVREDLVRIAVLTYLHGDLSPQSFKATMPEAVDLLCQPGACTGTGRGELEEGTLDALHAIDDVFPDGQPRPFIAAAFIQLGNQVGGDLADHDDGEQAEAEQGQQP